jgi:hypothetical protein
LSGAEVLTAAEYYRKDFETNGIAAHQRYDGKRVLFWARAETIDQDANGQPYVMAAGGVRLDLTSSARDGAATLKRGDGLYFMCESRDKDSLRACEPLKARIEALEKSLDPYSVLYGRTAVAEDAARKLSTVYAFGIHLPNDSECFTWIERPQCQEELEAFAQKARSDPALTAEITFAFNRMAKLPKKEAQS